MLWSGEGDSTMVLWGSVMTLARKSCAGGRGGRATVAYSPAHNSHRFTRNEPHPQGAKRNSSKRWRRRTTPAALAGRMAFRIGSSMSIGPPTRNPSSLGIRCSTRRWIRLKTKRIGELTTAWQNISSRGQSGVRQRDARRRHDQVSSADRAGLQRRSVATPTSASSAPSFDRQNSICPSNRPICQP